jgi:hypothetical protein
MVEIVFRGMNHLLGSKRAARMTAHAICNHSQRNAFQAGMRQDCNAILLLLAISLVLCSARINYD